MKKYLIVAVSLFCLAGVVRAETAGAYFKAGDFELTYPLANASAISLYDMTQGVGLLGAETSLMQYKRLNFNFGAVTSFLANGMPFVSLDFDWAGLITNASQTKLAKVGAWYGHDFKTNDNRAGLKASVALW